ncbi:MAG: DNA oxidative demethylase AlkB [Bradyrhizobium sp.]|nr:DNA oxidative demethylase AlkB [Bradyrhizobium sp.]
MTADFFDTSDVLPAREIIAEGAMLLRRFARPIQHDLLDAIACLSAQAPFRRMFTPGGYRMSVAMTNCGSLGWITDRTGYRYDAIDPDSGRPWPEMPPIFRELAGQAAAQTGFAGFRPEACLVNRYEPGTRLSLHQDRDESNYDAPIVSVSLGLPAIFLWGGLKRADKTVRYRLEHGDVVVWGGPSRLVFHGIAPLADGEHALLGRQRINLTFRQAR